MGVLQRFEQRLDRLVNGAFARAFRSEVQPVEIAAALQRELDDKAAVLDRERTVAPNVLSVELGPTDYERLAPYEQALGNELAAMVTEHAQTQGYHLLGPTEVSLSTVHDLPTGVFRVTSEGRAGVVAQPRHEQAPTDTPSAPLPSSTPHARLLVSGTAYPLTQTVTTVGRGNDVDIRIDDPGISRRHAEFRVIQGGTGFSVIDLASTNGTFVGPDKVGERLLSDGDEVRIGATSLVFRAG